MKQSMIEKAKRGAQIVLQKVVEFLTPMLNSSLDDLAQQQQARRQKIERQQNIERLQEEYQRPMLRVATEGLTRAQEHDLELGEQRSNHDEPDSSSQARQFEDVIKITKNLVPNNDKLLTYRALAGIDTTHHLTTAGFTVRVAPNLGIYPRVVLSEHRARKRYQTYHRLVNVCLAVQIVVGALLTALGASANTDGAVTAFGTINTIMAATLTYLKGSGLPDRFRASKDQWKEVREYIEQREREFCMEDCELSVTKEIAIIEDMYSRIGSVPDQLRGRGARGQANQANPLDLQQQQQRHYPLRHLSAETSKVSPTQRFRIPSGAGFPPEVKDQVDEEKGQERKLEEGQIALTPPPPTVLSHHDHGCPHVCEDCAKPKTD